MSLPMASAATVKSIYVQCARAQGYIPPKILASKMRSGIRALLGASNAARSALFYCSFVAIAYIRVLCAVNAHVKNCTTIAKLRPFRCCCGKLWLRLSHDAYLWHCRCRLFYACADSCGDKLIHLATSTRVMSMCRHIGCHISPSRTIYW